jgi:hypothetical protein
MKLNTAKRNIESGGMNISAQFTIEPNAKSFQVLSDGMYSNVVETIVRELSSNAFDAHIEAGKADVPFEVYCPSAFDPHFTVKDFGTGLAYYNFNAKVRNDRNEFREGAVNSTIFIKGDVRKEINGITLLILAGTESINIDTSSVLYDKSTDETVIRINGEYEGDDVSVEFDNTLVLYTTYFASTKEESNDYIGAFGLGSKTPFAYTDNFLVSNRFNGTLRVFNIYMSEDGMPQINLMGTYETEEDNGLEVKLAVEPDDYDEFKEAIASQLKYFSPLPTICNEPVSIPKVLHVGENFLLMDTTEESRYRHYGYNTGQAVVGNNAYKIKNVSSNLFQDQLVLRFNVGEVMVTSSREDLKYDDNTYQIISEREEAAINEYREYVLDTIDVGGLTDFEKADFLNTHQEVLDLSDKKIKKLVGNPNYRYGSRSIQIPISGWGDYTTVPYNDFPVYDDDNEVVLDDDGEPVTEKRVDKRNSQYVKALSWSKYGRGKTKTEKLTGNQFLSPTQKVHVFIRDTSYSFLKKISYYMEENEVDYNDTILVLDMFSTNASSVALEAIKELVGHSAEFILLSEIEIPKTFSYAPTDRNPQPVARLFEIEGASFSAPKYWTDIYTPLTKIDTDAYVAQTHRGNFDDLDYHESHFIDAYTNAGFEIDPDITILAMSRAKYDKAISYGFKPVSGLIKELREKIVIPVDLANYLAMNELHHKINRNDIVQLFEDFSADELDQIDNNDLGRIFRVRKIIKARYENEKRKIDFNKLDRISNYIPEGSMPEALKFVKDLVDNTTKLCDNLCSRLSLLTHLRSWELSGQPERKDAIEYINFKLNTGEENE